MRLTQACTPVTNVGENKGLSPQSVCWNEQSFLTILTLNVQNPLYNLQVTLYFNTHILCSKYAQVMHF